MSNTDTIPSPAELLAAFDKGRRAVVELESIIDAFEGQAFEANEIGFMTTYAWELHGSLRALGVPAELADDLEARLEDVIPPCGCGSCL